MTQIFISWSGSLGKLIAEYLYSDLFSYADLRPWISSHNIAVGSAWFEETKEALNNSDYGVVCLTPGASKKPWINFEIGWLYGKLNNCKIITFGEEIGNPLANLQRRNGLNRDTWFELLREMIPTEDRSDKEIDLLINNEFPKLMELYEQCNQSPHNYHCELDQQFSRIHDVMDNLKKNQYAENNSLFPKIIIKSYEDLINYSNNLESTYSIPASEYPKYLIYLQETIHPNPIVKAIALVDIEEDFWRFPTGNKIKETSQSESVRVFAFTKKDDMQSYFPILKEHARTYNVYAVSLQRLSDTLGDKAKDFSIINSDDIQVLATYDDESDIQNKKISFIFKPITIRDYEKSYEELMRSNFVVPIDGNKDYSVDEIRTLTRQVFYGLTLYQRKPVEMSLYINVFDYNDHEKEHAYYVEMTERMIEICQENHQKGKQKSIEILDMGAGTGIFTMSLANEIANKLMKLDAIEYDWHCYKILNIKTRQFAESHPEIEVMVHHEDSRTYDPPGEFDYIFSAFADHHIKKEDKEIYFENVKKNLKKGGLMIVGDEFLREYDPENLEEAEQALRDYHNHIISIARSQNCNDLAELEKQALKSGLLGLQGTGEEDFGDFKLSCSQYEQFLREAGFEFKREKIGPTSIDSIGGVYVYTAWLK
ncbi:MAG: methyltransferase domain-containing protein [Crocosphaera sp.]